MSSSLDDEAGLIGKIAIVWLLVLALLGVGAIDAASIAFTTYRLSDVGSAAAREGALVFKRTQDVRDTCERVLEVVAQEDPAVKLARGGCSIERPTGLVTVQIRKRASTLVTHRIPWTEDFALVEVSETAGPPSL
jgi:Tfp pilus assembly protein PilX